MVEVWGLRCESSQGVVGDPVVDAEPGAAGKACFPKIQGGGGCEGGGFLPHLLEHLFSASFLPQKE